MRFAQGFFVAIALVSSSNGATAISNGGRVRGQPSQRGGARRSMQKQTKNSAIEEQQHGRALEPESGFVSILCEDSPLKKCGNYVIDTQGSPIECCVDTPYNPASQGCCNGVVYDTATDACCGGIVFEMYSDSRCCGDDMDGNIYSFSKAQAIYGAQSMDGEGVVSGFCCGTHLVPSSDYCCGEDIIFDRVDCGEVCCDGKFVVEGDDFDACGCDLTGEFISCAEDESQVCVTVAGKGKSGNPEPDTEEELCISNDDLRGDNFEEYSVPIGESIGKGNTLSACGGCAM